MSLSGFYFLKGHKDIKIYKKKYEDNVAVSQSYFFMKVITNTLIYAQPFISFICEVFILFINFQKKKNPEIFNPLVSNPCFIIGIIRKSLKRLNLDVKTLAEGVAEHRWIGFIVFKNQTTLTNKFINCKTTDSVGTIVSQCAELESS